MNEFTLVDYLIMLMEVGGIPDQFAINMDDELRYGRVESSLKPGVSTVMPVVYIPLEASSWLIANALNSYIDRELGKILRSKPESDEPAVKASDVQDIAGRFATYDKIFTVQLRLKEGSENPDLMASEIEWTAWSQDKTDCKVGVIGLNDHEIKAVYDHINDNCQEAYKMGFHDLLMEAKKRIEEG